MSLEIASQRIKECKLTRETELDLSGMRLTEIPNEVWSLTWLQSLNLGYKEITEYEYASNNLITLSDGIGQLKLLTSLNLSGNHLIDLPNNIRFLQFLVELDLSENSLTNVPSIIGELKNLAVLDLHSNLLQNLPETISQLGSLRTLDLSYNQLKSLPNNLGELYNLSFLDLLGNGLESLPDSIGQLKSLTSLNLNGHRLRSLPNTISDLHNLTSLDLSGNYLTNLPDGIGGLHNLKTLNIRHNQLTNLPDTIGQLNNLNILDLWANRLTSLPDSIGNLQSLTYFSVWANQLKSLPDSIGQLESLISLDLRNNNLTTLPNSIGQLKSLISLDLRNNNLTNLPNSIGDLSALTSLDLSKHHLTNLPDTIGKLHNLVSLTLYSNQITNLPDSIGNLNNLRSLHLGDNHLRDLPDSIGDLSSLNSLNLSNNRLSNLPNTVGNLHNLAYFDVSGNQLSILPSTIGLLHNLTWIDVRGNKLNVLPSTIGQLQSLTSLDLHGHNLTTLPDTIGQLQFITFLNLSANQLAILPESIGELQSLVSLDLSNNRLLSLPLTIGRLHNLSDLDLRGNLLTDLPPTFGKLHNLISLNLTGNQLLSLPKNIGELHNLTALNLRGHLLSILPDTIGGLKALNLLDLSDNKLENLPNDIGRLYNLTSLNLKSNHLKEIPYSMTQLTSLREINLQDNPDLPIPVEIIRKPQYASAILDYIRATHVDRTVSINEIKVLVVGEADVGKTTLVKKLINEKVDIGKREPTSGISISDLQTQINRHEMLLHFWDFGGQEIMHNTHTLFLTTRSCYILVLDATQNEEGNQITKWLKTIHLYAPDAPVIVVINKSEGDFRLRLNLQNLEKHHPITNVIETSCLNSKGIKELGIEIEKTIMDLPHLKVQIPAKWMEVRKNIAQENKTYLEYKDFKFICQEQKIQEDENSVAEFLQFLGVLFTYGESSLTKYTHILNPNWLIKGIYPILTDQSFVENGGFIKDKEIEKLLVPLGYPKEKYAFILGMMFKFELAYRIDETTFFVPNLLPEETPSHINWDDAHNLKFVYKYDFLPPGLFSRFIVQMKSEVDPKFAWRTGVVLYQNRTPYSKILLNTHAKKIQIFIVITQSRAYRARTLLDGLRDKFESLHEEYKGLEVEELVPLQGTDAEIPYADLTYWAEHGEYKQSNRKAGKFDVLELLEGITARAYPAQNLPTPLSFDITTMPIRERRKRLATIIIKQFDLVKEIVQFLEFVGLEDCSKQLDTSTSVRDVAQSLILTLEKAGIHVEMRQPALAIFLNDLSERAEGQREAVEFLQAWARELEG